LYAKKLGFKPKTHGMSKDELCSELGYKTVEDVKDYRIIQRRACGPDKSSYNKDAWSRAELEREVVQRGLASKSDARTMVKTDLCVILSDNEVSKQRAARQPDDIELIPTAEDYVDELDYRGQPGYISAIIYWLVSRHKDACMYITNNYDEKFYYGIFFDCRQTISIAHDLIDRIKACTKRFYICLIKIRNPESRGGHVNFLLYDKKLNTVTMFEPLGQYRKCPAKKFLNNFIRSYFQVYLKAQLVRSCDICPAIGPQKLAVRQAYKYGIESNINNEGYCAAWTIMTLDMRLTYPDIPFKDLIDRTLERIQDQPRGAEHYIRSYIREAINIKYFIEKEAEDKGIPYIQYIHRILLKEVKNR
jgi:hypothetical protein